MILQSRRRFTRLNHQHPVVVQHSLDFNQRLFGHRHSRVDDIPQTVEVFATGGVIAEDAVAGFDDPRELAADGVPLRRVGLALGDLDRGTVECPIGLDRESRSQDLLGVPFQFRLRETLLVALLLTHSNQIPALLKVGSLDLGSTYVLPGAASDERKAIGAQDASDLFEKQFPLIGIDHIDHRERHQRIVGL